MASNGYSSTPGLSGVSGTGSSGSPAVINYSAANTSTTPAQSKGSLPFTGLDTGLMAATGAILVGFGVVLRLGAKRRSHDG
jgi:hypothetical protein